MKADIERNRQVLRVLCRIGSVLGWVLIVIAVWGIGVGIYKWKFLLEKGVLYRSVGGVISDCLFPGLVILGVAQFILYLVEDDYQPGWILLKGHLIFYLFALLVFASGIYGLIIANYTVSFMHFHMTVWILPILTKSLVLLGLGRVFQLALPIVAESKTLA